RTTFSSRARGITIHSSRSRFAARLNSGVRPQQESSMDDDAWSKAIAALIADSLVDGGVIDHEAVGPASEIIAAEVWARWLVRDYPPGASDSSERVTGEPTGASPAAGWGLAHDSSRRVRRGVTRALGGHETTLLACSN